MCIKTVTFAVMCALSLPATAGGTSDGLGYKEVKPSQEVAWENEVAKWKGYSTLNANLLYLEGVPEDAISVTVCGYTTPTASSTYALHASCNERDFIGGNRVKITIKTPNGTETRLEPVTPALGKITHLRLSPRSMSGVPDAVLSRFPFVTVYHYRQ